MPEKRKTQSTLDPEVKDVSRMQKLASTDVRDPERKSEKESYRRAKKESRRKVRHARFAATI